MGEVSTAFYEDVLTALGAPITPTTLGLLEAWQHVEGGTAENNPFNTTQPDEHSTDYNDAGVKNYPAPAIGVHATVTTLQLHYYAEVVLSLRSQDAARFGTAVDTSPWGTHGLAEYLREHPVPAPSPHPSPSPTPPGTNLPVLRLGAGMPPEAPSGPVESAQDLLRAHGFSVQDDGRFGPITEADVRSFQSHHGLAVDGVIGRNTWAALLRVA